MVSLATTKRERRPHRKSRTGCNGCKQRKIKCDESKPICLNCKRREIDCDWSQHTSKTKSGERLTRSESESARCSQNPVQTQEIPSDLFTTNGDGTSYGTLRFVAYTKFQGDESAVSTPQHEAAVTFTPSTSPSISEHNIHHLSERIEHLERRLDTQKATHQEPPNNLTYPDMALLHHYFNIPDKLPGDKELLETSFNNPHLLHLILGFSALHWVRQEPPRKLNLREQASKHYEIGMRGATQLLSCENETPETMELMYQSAALIGLYNLALGPQSGEYMGFSDHDGPASFFVFLRGVRTIRQRRESTQSLSEPVDTTPSATIIHDDDILSSVSYGLSPGYAEHLDHLRCLVQTSLADPLSSASRDASIYLSAIRQLEPYFEENQTQMDPVESATGDPTYRLAFGWLYRMSDGFMNRLQEKAPLALAIFACFAVVVKKLEKSWLVEGWPEHIVSGVWKFLRPDLRDLIRWPMRALGLAA